MSDFHLVDPQGWDCDLHSIYCAYIGHFQQTGITWYDRSWGAFFETFEDFLTFEWPVITVTDAWTGRAHIVTRSSSVDAFVKMIKTRYGEALPRVDNILHVSPFETGQRHLRKISDAATYKKVHATLPAARLAAQKTRVRNGQPDAIRELWEAKDKNFLAIDFEWSERNPSIVLEWGYAAMRCGALHAAKAWPPHPDLNYRRGHYIVHDYSDRVNKRRPTFPWAYAFDKSQVTSKAQLPRIIQAIISSLASPDSETCANNLVLVAHGIQEDLRRLQEMQIRIPPNVLMIDTAAYERQLFNAGQRKLLIQGPSGKPRAHGSTLSLTNLVRSLGVSIPCTMHNSGNDAMLCLFALQMLLEPEGTEVPVPNCSQVMGRPGVQGIAIPRAGSRSPGPGISLTPSPASAGFGRTPSPGPNGFAMRPRNASAPFDRVPSPVHLAPGPSTGSRHQSTIPQGSLPRVGGRQLRSGTCEGDSEPITYFLGYAAIADP